jgi:hypothetical protein
MCAHGGSCSAFAPGHALHLIQARLAASTPSEWIDAVVETVDLQTGEITLRSFADDDVLVVWSAGATAIPARAGEPVALHGRYQVLSAAGRRFNVARLS